jgi:hypothetical protein
MTRFDHLIRSLDRAKTRRGFVRMLGGVTAGSLLTTLGATEAVAGDLPGGAPCTRRRQCHTRKCVGPKGNKRCACSRCYFLDANGACQRKQKPMNGRCPCGFKETPDGFCYKNDCQDCYENVGGICVPEPAGIAPNGRCACGFTEVGGICVPCYPLPPR